LLRARQCDTQHRGRFQGQYSNAQELIVPAQTSGATQGTPVESALARILITTEERTSTADALQRLQDIARSRGGTPRVTEIGGWPAIIIEFTEPLPRRGAPQQEQEPPLALSDRRSKVRLSPSRPEPRSLISTSRSRPEHLRSCCRTHSRLRPAARSRPRAIRKSCNGQCKSCSRILELRQHKAKTPIDDSA